MTHPQTEALNGCWDLQGATAAAAVAATTTAAAAAVEAPAGSWPEQVGWVRVCTCDTKGPYKNNKCCVREYPCSKNSSTALMGVSLQQNSSIALQGISLQQNSSMAL